METTRILREERRWADDKGSRCSQGDGAHSLRDAVAHEAAIFAFTSFSSIERSALLGVVGVRRDHN